MTADEMLISNYVKNYLQQLNRKHIAWGHLQELDEIYDVFYKRETVRSAYPKYRHKKILDRLDSENYKNGIQKENAIFTKKLSQIGEDGKLARMFELKEHDNNERNINKHKT